MMTSTPGHGVDKGTEKWMHFNFAQLAKCDIVTKGKNTRILLARKKAYDRVCGSNDVENGFFSLFFRISSGGLLYLLC
jgi:hypothetical protein